MHVFRSLRGTEIFALNRRGIKNKKIERDQDADFAEDRDKLQSMSGFVVFD
jgi:hypothetical protein